MTRVARFTCIVSSLALSLALGCTRNGDDPPGGTDARVPPGVDGGVPVAGNLRIEPADQVVMLTAGSTQTLEYRAFLRDASGAETDVTAGTSWSSTLAALGTFTGNVFTTADRGGRTNIVATYLGMTTTTSLTLQLDRIILGPGATADTPGRFAGAAGAGPGPELVYPEDATMVPPNLQQLEFHYMPNGGDAFELVIEASALNLRIYFGCPERAGGGCIYTPERSAWETIATAGAGQDPMTYRLRSVSAGGEIRESAPRTITIAQEPITGGLYYWNAGGGSIDRFEFGVPGARAETFIDRGRTGAVMCVGCHALSRDGTRIAVGTDIPTTTFQVFDVATRARVFSLGGGGGGIGAFPSQPNFSAWSPDSRQLVTSFNTGLSIRDAATGAITTDRLGGGPSSQPDWSPDGNHIVFVRHDAPSFGGLVDVGGVTSGRITIMDRDGSGWGAPRTIVAIDGVNNYYPAYSPDGRFISFCRSPSNVNSMGADPDSGTSAVPDAQLWLIPSDRSGAARQLTRIGGLADSWPKWDPTEYEHQGRPLYWMSWTSRRAYGLRLGDDERAQIWMAAFDPMAAATEGEQGFRAAFWLPFQDIGTSNHIPQWVTSVERQTCTTNADCGGEFCVDGRCFEEEPLL